MDLEYYKPKQEILSLSDDEIELWYNKDSVEFVRLIEKCEITSTSKTPHIKITYSRIINNNFLVDYLTNSKSLYLFYHEPYKFDSNKMTKIINDLFNYKINRIC